MPPTRNDFRGSKPRTFARALSLGFFFWMVLGAAPPGARGGENGNPEGVLRARLSERKPPGAPKESVTLLEREATVLKETKDEAPRYFVVLKFRVAAGWKVWGANALVAESKPGETSVIVYLRSMLSNITLEARPAAEGAVPFPEQVVIRLPTDASQLFEDLQPQAKVFRPPANRRIVELSLTSETVPLRFIDEKNRVRPFVNIRGRFQKPGWKLSVLRKDRRVVFGARQRPQGLFEISALALKRDFPVVLVAVGPGGQRVQEILRVAVPARWVTPETLGEPTGPSGFFVSAGITGYRYFQNAFGNFHASALYLGLSFDHVFRDSRFGISAGGSGQVLTLQSEPGSYGPQVFQGDLDASYRLNPVIKRPVDTHLLVGLDYVTLISNSSPFGFANLILPEIGARAIWQSRQGASLSGDLRYAPAGEGVGGLFSIAQRDLDLRLVYTSSSRDYPWQLIFRLKDLRYRPTEATLIELTTFSLGLGFGL